MDSTHCVSLFTSILMICSICILVYALNLTAGGNIISSSSYSIWIATYVFKDHSFIVVHPKGSLTHRGPKGL